MCFKLLQYSEVTGNTLGVSKHVEIQLIKVFKLKSLKEMQILSEILLQYIYNHYCIATCLEKPHALPVILLYWKSLKHR